VSAPTRNVRLLVTAQLARFGIQTLGLAVLSRLLKPEDFGILAMVMAVAGLASVVGDFGLSLATIREEALTDEEWSNIFWLNAGIGAVLSACVAGLSPVMSWFYQDGAVATVCLAISPVFLLNSLSSQFRAELVRRDKFKPLALIETLAPATAVLVAIVMGILSPSVWALVAQQLVAPAVLGVLSLMLVRKLPQRPKNLGQIRRFVAFGSVTTVSSIMNYISSSAAPALLGRFAGDLVTGLYNRAFTLFMLPLQQIGSPMTRAVLPALSRSHNSPAFERQIGKAQVVLAGTLGLLLSVLGGLAKPVVAIVLGDQWDLSASLVQILALGGLFQVLGYVYYWAFLAANRMRVLLICELPGRIVTISLTLIVVRDNPLLAAAIYAAGLAIIAITSTMFGVPQLGLERRPLIVSALRWLAVQATVYVSCRLAVAYLCASLTPIPSLAVGVVVAAGAFGICALVSAQIRHDVTTIISTLLDALKSRA
jgi:PST family polysaccharide transporter